MSSFMSPFDDGQPSAIRPWASIIPTENPANFLYLNQNVESEGPDDQPAEARAWATYRSEDTENVLADGPTRQQQSLLSPAGQGQEHQSEVGPRGVAQVLSYIDQRRPPRQKKYRLTWRSFIGTMPGMEQIYARDGFLRYYEEFRPVFIFMDSVFRGISQVMFANNPLSGIIITVGLLIGNWELALYGLLGTCVSTLTAHVLGFSYNSIRAGLYGYNGCLTAMGIAYFSFSHSPQMIGPIVVMSAFSTVFVMAVGKILVQRLELSPFTFSFQICSWIWLLGALKYRFFFINGAILSPALLTTLIDKPSLSNVSLETYTVEDNFVGFFASISQVYFVENPYTGAIILVGVCVCSRILSFFALFGAVTGQITAAYLLGLPATAIHAGLWGFNSVLTCQALGGMFFVLHGYRIWALTLFGSIMTVLVQAGVSAFLAPVGMPTFTFPFTVICWIFCLIAGSKNLVAVKLTAVSIPEDHYRRFRLSRLVKAQFQFISHFTHLSSSHDEDITWEELSKIKQIFVPVLMCSYVYRNDINSLRTLMKQKVNVHSTDQNLRSPLHISVSQGNVTITKWLVEDLKVNVNLVDKYGGTPLFDALWHGHFHLLPFLYSRGARLPAAKSRELAFYLNAFVYEGNLEGMQCLLSCGFNPNAGDYDGRNALHLAVITNQYDIVRYLVEQFPIWLQMPDYFQQTPMSYAMRLPDLAIANYLLSKTDYDPVVSKKVAEKSTLLQVIVERNLAKMKNFEKQEEDRFTANTYESLLPTLFCMIAAKEDTSVVANFLKEFSHINALESVDYDFRSAAHVAAAEGQLETMQLLCEQCQAAELQRIMNREDRWGISPLDEAYRNGHLHIAQFINQYRSNPTDPIPKEAVTATDAEFKSNAIVQALWKWHKVYLFNNLAASGAAERIDGLFARHYFLPEELYADYHGRNPMHFAAANGHLNVIQVLIRNGYTGATQSDRWEKYPVDEARLKKFDQIAHELMHLKL